MKMESKKKDNCLIELHNKLKGVSFTKNEKKFYFDRLYNLLSDTDWKSFEPWIKFEFFRRYFVSISDEYVGVYILHENLIKKQFPNIKIDYSPSGLYIMYQDSPTKETMELNSLTISLFSLPLSRGRDFFLRMSTDMFKDEPVKNLSIKNVSEELKIVKRFEKVWRKQSDAQKFILIDIKYPSKLILEQIKMLIKEEQKKYYLKYPKLEKVYIKKTKDEKETTYPFNQWERYLKVFILKQKGEKTRELSKQFYSKYHLDPQRQILRDKQKAIKLSQNALTDNFPGKY